MPATLTVTREQVIRFRFHRHQLDRAPNTARQITDVDLLDYGVQDTGTDGSLWALAIRGAKTTSEITPATKKALLYAWTLRGAPHAYRRADVKEIAAATAPWSDADAAKRIFDASKPLKDAGIANLDALELVATSLRGLAAKPIVKGDASGALNEKLSEPFLRFCRSCDATHIYEQPFRLSALQGGLELEPGTSPPLIRRIPTFKPPLFASRGDAKPRFDVVRNYLRFFGPARRKDATAFLDASAKDVDARWPDDAIPVDVKGESAKGKNDQRWLLPEDEQSIVPDTPAENATGIVRLLGPYDPYLQLRDRELLVPDAARRKELWRVIGRPGAVVLDGDVIATWRPKSSGGSLTLTVDPWTKIAKRTASTIEDECERLAAHRGVKLKDVAGLP